MICKRCKRLADDDFEYCPYCGKSFFDDSEQPVENIETEKEGEYNTIGFDNNGDKTAPGDDTSPDGKVPINIFGGNFDKNTRFQYQSRPRRPSVARAIFSATLYFFFYLFVNILVTAIFLSSAMLDSMYDIAEQYYTKTATSMVNGMKKRSQKYTPSTTSKSRPKHTKMLYLPLTSVLLLSSTLPPH